MSVVNYLKYINPITGKRGIFTRERIKKMSPEKFAQREKQIMIQLKDVGIPYNNEVGKRFQVSNEKPEIIFDESRPAYEIIGYEWIAFDGACEDCLQMNGKVFASESDIPDKLHPNCRCEVYALYY